MICKPFVLGDDLRAEQQECRRDLQAQQYGDGGGQRSVHRADLRQGGEVPDQQVP